MKKRTPRPLILLDVDGVINSYNHDGSERGMMRLTCLNGQTIRTTPWMVSLIQHLTEVAEVKWCTAWRTAAADYLAPVMGLPALEVVNDKDKHLTSGGVLWKPAAAEAHIAAALAEGREVIWIEDFSRHNMRSGWPSDKVMEIDTTPTHVLLPRLLPPHILRGWHWEGSTEVPAPTKDDWGGMLFPKKDDTPKWWNDRRKNLANGSHALIDRHGEWEPWDDDIDGKDDDPDNPWNDDDPTSLDPWAWENWRKERRASLANLPTVEEIEARQTRLNLGGKGEALPDPYPPKKA